MPRIQIVDQEARLHEALVSVLKPMGHEVISHFDAKSALTRFQKDQPELMILEAELDGIDLLRKIREIDSTTRVILTTAFPRKEVALASLRHGAFDLLIKPLNIKNFVEAINRALASSSRRPAAVIPIDQDASDDLHIALIGASEEAEALREQLKAIRDSHARTPVLLQGVFGSGKREVARHLHNNNGFAATPFRELNCRKLSEEELRAQLIGEDGGLGPLFAEIHGGTLVIEHIDAMPDGLQEELAAIAKLIEKEVFWISCSDIDLDQALSEGAFNMKLYFQISGDVIGLPALRDRISDIPEMIPAILKGSSSVPEACRTATFLSKTIKAMQKYHWPENLIELERVVAVAAMESKGGTVEPESLRLRATANS